MLNQYKGDFNIALRKKYSDGSEKYFLKASFSKIPDRLRQIKITNNDHDPAIGIFFGVNSDFLGKIIEASHLLTDKKLKIAELESFLMK